MRGFFCQILMCRPSHPNIFTVPFYERGVKEWAAHAMKRLRTEKEEEREEADEEGGGGGECLFFELTSRFSNESTFKSVPNLGGPEKIILRKV